MKKITSKQVFTYVFLLGIIAIVAMYFLVYKKNMELVDQKNASNAVLNERVKALEQYIWKKWNLLRRRLMHY